MSIGPKTLSFVLAVTFLCLWSVNLSAQQNLAPTDLIAKARADMDRRSFKSAEKELKQALKIQPDSAEAFYLLATVYDYENNLSQALIAVDKSISLKPDYPDARYLYVRITMDAGRAIDSHVRVDRSGQSRTVYDIGKLLSLRKQLNQAIEDGAKFSEAYDLAGDLEMAYSAYRSSTDTPLSKSEDRSEPARLIYIKAMRLFDEALRLAKPNQIGLAQLKAKADFLKEVVDDNRPDSNSYVVPKVLEKTRPSYTEDARRHKVQGIVVLGVRINERGRPNSGIIMSGLGFGLDKEALNVINHMTMSPAMLNGRPVPVTIFVTVTFSLAQQRFNS